VPKCFDAKKLDVAVIEKHDAACCWKISQCPKEFCDLPAEAVVEIIDLNFRSFAIHPFSEDLKLEHDIVGDSELFWLFCLTFLLGFIQGESSEKTHLQLKSFVG
jgi:hypothetical protein